MPLFPPAMLIPRIFLGKKIFAVLNIKIYVTYFLVSIILNKSKEYEKDHFKGIRTSFRGRQYLCFTSTHYFPEKRRLKSSTE